MMAGFVILSSGAANTMGHQISSLNFDDLNESIVSLQALVAEHGVVVLPLTPPDMTSDDLLAFANRLGSPVPVPNGFGFNSTGAESFITNISNIDAETDQVRADIATAEYLHNDGDFWQDNYIITVLYGDVIPPFGGQTQFIDLQLAHDLLRENERATFDAIENQNVTVDVNQIPDFQGSAFLDIFNAKHGVASHAMVEQHRVTNEPVLYYACQMASIEGLADDESSALLKSINDMLLSSQGISYEHEWEQGHMVIWDNTRVMHRAMGGHQFGRRKLWRVQTRPRWSE